MTSKSLGGGVVGAARLHAPAAASYRHRAVVSFACFPLIQTSLPSSEADSRGSTTTLVGAGGSRRCQVWPRSTLMAAYTLPASAVTAHRVVPARVASEASRGNGGSLLNRLSPSGRYSTSGPSQPCGASGLGHSTPNSAGRSSYGTGPNGRRSQDRPWFRLTYQAWSAAPRPSVCSSWTTRISSASWCSGNGRSIQLSPPSSVATRAEAHLRLPISPCSQRARSAYPLSWLPKASRVTAMPVPTGAGVRRDSVSPPLEPRGPVGCPSGVRLAVDGPPRPSVRSRDRIPNATHKTTTATTATAATTRALAACMSLLPSANSILAAGMGRRQAPLRCCRDRPDQPTGPGQTVWLQPRGDHLGRAHRLPGRPDRSGRLRGHRARRGGGAVRTGAGEPAHRAPVGRRNPG